MTRFRTMRRRLKRMALVCFMATATICQSDSLHAQETHDSGELCGWIEDLSQVVRLTPRPESSPKPLTPQFFSITVGEELSITTCNYDTWLSNTLATTRTAESSTLSSADTVRPSSDDTGKSVLIRQWSEPYANVGLNQGDSPEKILAFQSWFDHQGMHPERSPWPRDYVPVVDFDGELSIVERDGLVLIETTRQTKVPATPVQPSKGSATSNPFIGGSPVIALIPEAYLPYDLAERDRDDVDLVEQNVQSPQNGTDVTPEAEDVPRPVVWVDGIFAPMGQPFCVRSLVEGHQPNWSPLLTSLSEKQETGDSEATAGKVGVPESTSTSDVIVTGSPDCWLDEIVWHVNATLEDADVANWKLRPGKIGQRVASLVVSGDRLASRVVGELALVWPAAKPPVAPPPGIGARLLARAKAVERLDAEQPGQSGPAGPLTPEQLAQTRAKLLQWVGVARSVIDDLSLRLTDVAEVARNRGAQDETIRR